MSKRLEIKRWTPEHDSTGFSSSLASISNFIQGQAARVTSSRVSNIFVLVEAGDNKVRGYYTLSALSVKFDELPKNVQNRLPRYPQIGATLLGRLGVDEAFRDSLRIAGHKLRLGEMLLVDAQKKCLNATAMIAAAVSVVEAEEPSPEDFAAGARDSLGFYLQYGFIPFPNSPRRLFKRLTTIEKELNV